MSQTGNVAATLDPPPASWTSPGQSDSFATAGLITLLLVLFLVVYLYAVFDRFAAGRGEVTPLRTTIPTMLTVGLAYDLIPPLADVSLLLPLTLIVAALALDITLWMKPRAPVVECLPEEHPAEERQSEKQTVDKPRKEERPAPERQTEESPNQALRGDDALAAEGPAND
ncbi:hypothetical protein [Labrenzia sp. 011]|uniref:hypothetical protein n=1 Tax=Labrenzia sp. 011 TaxID=2171494 RepID=UPI000D51FA9A|nr:hypothetical protein [Labrenzia sp. 011]PVB60701.1 hypothetical protein DCO57_16055 [Labrenzia sp. 011]